MTQMPPDLDIPEIGLHAFAAEVETIPTEMGLRVTVRSRAAIVTAEFDMDEEPAILLGILRAMPDIVISTVDNIVHKKHDKDCPNYRGEEDEPLDDNVRVYPGE